MIAPLIGVDYKGKPEQAIVFHVQAWDVNCPQHIKSRWTEQEIAPMVRQLRDQVERLEDENRRLRNELQFVSTGVATG